VKKVFFFLILLATVFFVAMNSSMVADQALEWVKENPKHEYAPAAIYRAARWCDLLGDNNKAMTTYWELYQRYPERGDLCAPALYHMAQIVLDTSVAKQRAKDYLQIIMDQYASNEEWSSKAKQLYDEVSYGH